MDSREAFVVQDACDSGGQRPPWSGGQRFSEGIADGCRGEDRWKGLYAKLLLKGFRLVPRLTGIVVGGRRQAEEKKTTRTEAVVQDGNVTCRNRAAGSDRTDLTGRQEVSE